MAVYVYIYIYIFISIHLICIYLQLCTRLFFCIPCINIYIYIYIFVNCVTWSQLSCVTKMAAEHGIHFCKEPTKEAGKLQVQNQ